jgi:hypothetical protein
MICPFSVMLDSWSEAARHLRVLVGQLVMELSKPYRPDDGTVLSVRTVSSQ